MNFNLIKHFILSIILFFSLNCFAQTSTTDEEVILTVADEMPSFPGGDVEMIKFLNHNLKYPSYEATARIQGKCFLSFVVEKDGSITNIKVLKGIPNSKGCTEEAIRVVNLMPKWVPGKKNGELVRAQFNLPINFVLKPIDAIRQTDTIYLLKD